MTLKLCLDLLCIIQIFVGYGKDPHLFRAQPCREFSCIVLDEPCKCSLIAAHGCSVDDPGSCLVAVLIDIVHTEFLSRLAVELDRYHGIFLAVNVLGLDIDLRSVEGSLAVLFIELDVIFYHNLTEIILSAVPILFISEVFFFIVRIPF